MEHIKVVLASPSDLSEERQMIKDLLDDEINPTYAKYGVHFELRRWEDTLPGLNVNGPQGKIDIDLEIPDSDIFICLYGNREGTIIETEGVGGTEHELNIALDNNYKYGKPDIKVFFKDFCEDPTLRNEKIHAIEKRLRSQALYGKFSSLEDLKAKIRTIFIDAAMSYQTRKRDKAEGIIEYIGVSTTEEFVLSIAPNKHIIIRTSVIDALDFRDPTTFVNKKEVHDGDECVLHDLYGTTIEAKGEQKPIIITRPRYAAVLTLMNCEDMTISGVALGHTPDKGGCSGPVLRLVNCRNIQLMDLKLFGCGTYGIQTDKCENITLTDSEIYECTYGAVDSKDSNITLSNCRIYDCNSPYGLLHLISVDGGHLCLRKVEVDRCTVSQFLIYLEQGEKCYPIRLHEPMSHSVLTCHGVEINHCTYPHLSNCDIITGITETNKHL